MESIKKAMQLSASVVVEIDDALNGKNCMESEATAVQKIILTQLLNEAITLSDKLHALHQALKKDEATYYTGDESSALKALAEKRDIPFIKGEWRSHRAGTDGAK